jgi:hypothetical protein
LHDQYERANARRFVVIVDRKGRIVTREETSDPAFAAYMHERLPYEVELLARSQGRRNQTHVLSNGALVHVVPIRGTSLALRALVFEQTQRELI